MSATGEVYVQDVEGMTPLHWALSAKTGEMACALVSLPNLDPSLPNRAGFSAVHWAAAYGRREYEYVSFS